MIYKKFCKVDAHKNKIFKNILAKFFEFCKFKECLFLKIFSEKREEMSNIVRSLLALASLGVIGYASYYDQKKQSRKNPRKPKGIKQDSLLERESLTDDAVKDEKFVKLSSLDLKDIIGQRVSVYYNLHLHTFSVRAKVRDADGVARERVVAHADYVQLTDVNFDVRQNGRYKVREEKQKNVHAFVKGTLKKLVQYDPDPSIRQNLSAYLEQCKAIPETSTWVTYNPYDDAHDRFYVKEIDPRYSKKDYPLVKGTTPTEIDPQTGRPEKIDRQGLLGSDLILEYPSGVDMMNYNYINKDGHLDARPFLYLKAPNRKGKNHMGEQLSLF